MCARLPRRLSAAAHVHSARYGANAGGGVRARRSVGLAVIVRVGSAVGEDTGECANVGRRGDSGDAPVLVYERTNGGLSGASAGVGAAM